jgi:hypothetical protein
MKLIYLNVCYGELEKPLFDFINEHKKTTDVFCFQESSDELQKRNKLELLGFNNVAVQKYVGPSDNYFQSTYVKDNITIQSKITLFEGQINLGLATIIQASVGAKTFCIGNLHGVWRPPKNKLDTPDRLEQSKKLIEAINNFNGFKIIGGDFNLNPETESIKMFEEAGCINLIKEFGIKTTRNEYAWKNWPNNKQYFSDYLFVGPDIKVNSFEVPEMTISDHLPMILETED